MTNIDWMLDRLANNENLALPFRNAISKKYICSSCKANITEIGQEPMLFEGKMYCEDCYDAVKTEADRFAEEMRKEEDILRRELERG